MSVYFLDIPCTEEIEKIRNANVGAENQRDSNQRVLYKIHESGEYAEYHGIFESVSEDDGNDYIVIPFKSACDSVVDVSWGTPFVNVKGSSGDCPDYGSSWLGFYKETTGKTPDHCFTDGFLYYADHSHSGCVCGKNLVGGHVIFDSGSLIAFDPRVTPLPKHAWIGIVPICMTHNSNNENYMVLKKSEPVVKIRYTLPKVVYKKLLEKARNENE